MFQEATFVRAHSPPPNMMQVERFYGKNVLGIGCTNLVMSQWATYIGSIVYTVPTCFSKLAILLFLLELNSNQAWYRWTVYVGMFVVAGSSIGIFFSSVFPCKPFRKTWDLAIPPEVGSCIDRWAMFQATAGLGVATDLLLIAIPVPMIIGLHLSVKKKVALLGMFAIGSMYACAFRHPL